MKSSETTYDRVGVGGRNLHRRSITHDNVTNGATMEGMEHGGRLVLLVVQKREGGGLGRHNKLATVEYTNEKKYK